MQLLNTALLNTAALLSAIPLKKVVRCGASCVLALTLPGIILAQERALPNQPTVPPNQVATPIASPQDAAALSSLPDSPGAAWAKEQNSEPQQDGAQQTATTPLTPTGFSSVGSSQTGSVQSDASQDATAQDQSQKPQRPVGTAAAEAPKVNGITSAQPAGVAIAPAKQRRVRTIVLRVGAVVGAGVAVGAVVALTAGTASKPPGAR